jgi:hypothetical protein
MGYDSMINCGVRHSHEVEFLNIGDTKVAEKSSSESRLFHKNGCSGYHQKILEAAAEAVTTMVAVPTVEAATRIF